MYDDDIKIKDVIISLLLFILIIVLGYYNYKLAIISCESIGISFDLTLSIISSGFGYDITILFTIIELGFLLYIYNFIKKKCARFCF